jgi:hypothetical protein
VVEGQDFELILKSHLQRPIPFGLQDRALIQRAFKRIEQLNDRASAQLSAVYAAKKRHFVNPYKIKYLQKSPRDLIAICQAKNDIIC